MIVWVFTFISHIYTLFTHLHLGSLTHTCIRIDIEVSTHYDISFTQPGDQISTIHRDGQGLIERRERRRERERDRHTHTHTHTHTQTEKIREKTGWRQKTRR